MSATPQVSIVIPIYNEEAILKGAVAELREQLAEAGINYEIILAENGSTDQTVAIARDLADRNEELRSFSIGEPNYGRALKQGIMRARGEFVICEEIDLCDIDFHKEALRQLQEEGVDFVVGSKRLRGAQDRRPLYRRLATRVLNNMLRFSVGFQGTDTHGLKAFRRAALLKLVDECVVERDMFASELVVRVHRSEISWVEVPIDLKEKRPPSIHLFRRVPHVFKSMIRLTMIIRTGRDL